MDNRTENDIEQLNSFLRGEISAVETYEQAISKVEDSTVIAQLERLKASHRSRVTKLENKIRAMGGTPANDSGVWGSFAQLVEGGAKVFGTKAALAALEEGEDHGRDDYRGDLEDLSTPVAEFVRTELIPEQQRTHDALSQLQKKL